MEQWDGAPGEIAAVDEKRGFAWKAAVLRKDEVGPLLRWGPRLKHEMG